MTIELGLVKNQLSTCSFDWTTLLVTTCSMRKGFTFITICVLGKVESDRSSYFSFFVIPRQQIVKALCDKKEGFILECSWYTRSICGLDKNLFYQGCCSAGQ